MSMTYKELKKVYKDNFTLGYLNTDIKNKFALISLICYTVYKLKEKKPDITYYQIINKLSDGSGMNELEKYSLAIICEDFAYGCRDFPTFELKGKEITEKIKELLKSYMPF